MHRIVAVEYLNTLPYIRAIQHSALLSSQVEMITADPKECAKALADDSADLVLLPVGSFADFHTLYMPVNFGIACFGAVHTVGIFSDKKWDNISSIKQSASSRTSNQLLKVLNTHFWNNNKSIQSHEVSSETDAILIIGDEAFEAHHKFKYCYDLGNIWRDCTGLPFVFAAWMSTKKLEKPFIQLLNQAFSEVVQMDSLISLAANLDKSSAELISYFKSKILYTIDEKMIESLKYFFELSNWNWNINIGDKLQEK